MNTNKQPISLQPKTSRLDLLIHKLRIPYIASWIEIHPVKALIILLIIHATIWTLLPSLTPMNVPIDMLEASFYGREKWQLGYHKLPGLPWYLIGLVDQFIGSDRIIYFFISQIIMVSTFVLVFLTALPFLGGLGAFISVLIINGSSYFTFESLNVNHDTLQCPLWALAGYGFSSALTRGKAIHWLIVGLAIGISFWVKYFVVILVIPLVFFMILDPIARKSLKTPGPWLALATTIVIALPHLIWLFQNDFIPYNYVNNKSATLDSWFSHIFYPFRFVFREFSRGLTPFLIALPLFWPNHPESLKKIESQSNMNNRIIRLLAFGPLLTLGLISFLMGRGIEANWPMPCWLFFGLWCVAKSKQVITQNKLSQIIAAWFCISSTSILLIYLIVFIFPILGISPGKNSIVFPGDLLAQEISQKHYSLTKNHIHYIIGCRASVCNISYYLDPHPHIILDGNTKHTPWIDLKDFKSKGGVIVWFDEGSNELPIRYQNLSTKIEIQSSFEIPFRIAKRFLKVRWAIIPPETEILPTN